VPDYGKPDDSFARERRGEPEPAAPTHVPVPIPTVIGTSFGSEFERLVEEMVGLCHAYGLPIPNAICLTPQVITRITSDLAPSTMYYAPSLIHSGRTVHVLHDVEIRPERMK
jgi:hypothetical protein